MTILLHGALAAASQFDELTPLLSDSEVFLALNLPGHGGNDASMPFSLSAMSRSVIDALDRRQINKAALFGYSMGGFVALHTAAHYPDRIEKVCTVNTKLAWDASVAQRLNGMMNPEKIKAKAPAMAHRLAQWHAPENWETVAEQTIRFLDSLGQSGGLTEDEIQSVLCPVLILRGENDAVVTIEECQNIQRRLPQAQYEALADSGHLWEQINLQTLAQLWNAFEKQRPNF